MTAEPAYAIDMALAMIRSGLDDALSQIRAQLTALADRKPPRPFAPPRDSAFPVVGRIFRLTGAEIQILALSRRRRAVGGAAQARLSRARAGFRAAARAAPHPGAARPSCESGAQASANHHRLGARAPSHSQLAARSGPCCTRSLRA